MKTLVVLTISDQLRNILPPPTDEQREQLEANILADGVVHDPICYWYDGSENLIVDGMNRYEIAEAHGIEYETREMEFPNIEAAELWMLQRQAGRRNNTPQQLSEMRGRIYNLLKVDDKANLIPGGPSEGKFCPPSETLEKTQEPKKTTAEKVAEQFDVSPRTVKSDAKRVSIIDNLKEGVKNALGKTVHDAAMADLQKFAKLDEGAQSIVARAVRTGQAKTLKDALKTVPAGKSDAKPKPPVKALEGREADAFDARASIDGMMKTIDQWVRNVNWTIDRIRGEFPSPTGDDVLKHLQATYAAMKKWKGLVK